MFLSGATMALIVGGIYSIMNKFMPTGNLYLIINIMICTFVGVLVYIFMLIILKVDELKELISLKKKNKKF